MTLIVGIIRRLAFLSAVIWLLLGTSRVLIGAGGDWFAIALVPAIAIISAGYLLGWVLRGA